MPDTATALAPVPEPGTDAAAAAIWADAVKLEQQAESAKDPADAAAAPAPVVEDKTPASPPEPAADAADKGNKAATVVAEADPWVDAPPALVAARDAIKADADKTKADWLKRNDGVVSGLTKARNTLAAENESLKQQLAGKAPAKPAATDKPKDGIDPDPADKAGSEFEDDPEFKALLKDYPDVAMPMANFVKRQVAKLAGEVGTLSAARQVETALLEEKIVDAKHPDYDQVIAAPEFLDWYKTAPRYIQSAIERNGQGVRDGQEVVDLVSRFKTDTGWKTKPAAAEKPAAPSNAAKPPDPKRAAQLDSASSPRGTKGAQVTADEPPEGATPEQIWEWAARKDAREAASKR